MTISRQHLMITIAVMSVFIAYLLGYIAGGGNRAPDNRVENRPENKTAVSSSYGQGVVIREIVTTTPGPHTGNSSISNDPMNGPTGSIKHSSEDVAGHYSDQNSPKFSSSRRSTKDLPNNQRINRPTSGAKSPHGSNSSQSVLPQSRLSKQALANSGANSGRKAPSVNQKNQFRQHSGDSFPPIRSRRDRRKNQQREYLDIDPGYKLREKANPSRVTRDRQYRLPLDNRVPRGYDRDRYRRNERARRLYDERERYGYRDPYYEVPDSRNYYTPGYRPYGYTGPGYRPRAYIPPAPPTVPDQDPDQGNDN